MQNGENEFFENENIDIKEISKLYAQSEEENREIRVKYRNLLEDMKTSEVSTKMLIEKLSIGNELYRKVNRTQEATLDSQFLLMSAELGAKQADSIKLMGETFDADEWIDKLITVMGGRRDIEDEASDKGNELDWEIMGLRSEPYIDMVPKIDNLIGPISAEQKEKKAITRHSRDSKNSANLKKPQELRKEDIVEQENETTKNVIQICNLLEQKGRVNFFEFVINPKSFGQTVENIFYLSFLIRDGKVLLDEEDGELMLERTDPPNEEDYSHGITKKQLIMELDVETWKEIIQTYNIKKSMIPQRPKLHNNTSKWYG